MPSLKEIKNRIASVASTQQTTSAMKLISASKLRKAQLTLQQLRPYAGKLNQIMQQIIQDGETHPKSPFLEVRKPKNVLLIVVTSNSGLCGAFNTTVLKAAMTHIQNYYLANPEVKNISICCFGKKAAEFFAKKSFTVVENHIEIMSRLSFEECDQIAEKLLQDFKNHTYDLIEMVSNDFVNAAVYETAARQQLPYETEEPEENEKKPTDYYFYSPNKEAVIHNIIPISFKVRFYTRFAESIAAEYAARMTSMHKASENASQLQKELKLHYNKVRQASITNEIIEITNGANALKTVK